LESRAIPWKIATSAKNANKHGKISFGFLRRNRKNTIRKLIVVNTMFAKKHRGFIAGFALFLVCSFIRNPVFAGDYIKSISDNTDGSKTIVLDDNSVFKVEKGDVSTCASWAINDEVAETDNGLYNINEGEEVYAEKLR